ncbi:hypothetical protein [Curtobacterium sp. MCSS17_007]|uniref:hypothetical protein n=1 Tax=Curtobacterium sp. MCSS17_007 TaxID=2175646 RepID=UPI000DAAAD51|nr:hypothetical protein [Curtobacterium sp. MCSS17_007]WIE75332.1 hypothetical protein DEJ22_013940 [Curtobacterium sp. MCSS17_007]
MDMRVLRGRVVAALLLVVFLVVPALFLYVGPITLKMYDAGHQIKIVCSVSSAESSTDSSYSSRGVGASTLGIAIKTEDCGPLALRWGLTGANVEEKTRRLDAGGKWCFTVGRGSYELRDLLHRVRQAVFVRDATRCGCAAALNRDGAGAGSEEPRPDTLDAGAGTAGT